MKFVKTEVRLLTSLPFHLLTADIPDYLITQTHTPTNTKHTYTLIIYYYYYISLFICVYTFFLLPILSALRIITCQYKHLDFLFYSLVICCYCTLRKHAYSNVLKILHPKNENSQIKISDIFSYFCSKHRLRVLVRTASPRRF